MLTQQEEIIWYSLANPQHKQTPLLQLSLLMHASVVEVDGVAAWGGDKYFVTVFTLH